MLVDAIQDIYKKRVLVLGCGNILFGDDGFGPEVADHMNEHCMIPDDAAVLNVGTSARKILFNVALYEKRPSIIIIIDAVDCGRVSGEIFELTPEQLPEKKVDDFSMHQMPASNLLKELKDLCSVDVRIIACQVESIPDCVRPGLSVVMKNAIPDTVDRIMELINGIKKANS
jgi:coenzyme F420 hydrogenase subunit delta